MDPVERETNKYLEADAAYEAWYERNEDDLAEEFFVKYGVNGLDTEKFGEFVDSRWRAKGEA